MLFDTTGSSRISNAGNNKEYIVWKSSVDLEEIMERVEGINLLEKLYSLSVFWKNAIYPEDYSADDSWPTLLKFSNEGESLFGCLEGVYEKSEEPNFFLALFGKFFHHDLIFDHNASNIEGIEALLEKEILTEKIRFPYRFGRCLYDRFNDIHQTNRTSHLLSDDVKKLIDGTPKGVYQVGNIIVGPLGVITSVEPRSIYPSLELPLWHCSDTGCNAIHLVDLMPPTTPALQRIYRVISQQVGDQFGPPSEWWGELRWHHRKGRWDNGRKYSTIIEIIADCIFGQERTALVTHALKGNSKQALREILAKPPRKSSMSEGSPEDVAGRLTPEEQLQLLMTLDDSSLIEYIDEIVARKIIKIPLGERRMPEFSAMRTGDDPAELSSLGIRSCSENAIINLSALVWNAYDSEGLINELAWKLRQAGGKSTRELLFKYIRANGPETTIRELVLSSSTVTKIICKEVKLSLSHVATSDDISVERMLWKLGFNPEEYDDLLTRIKSRLNDFNEKLLLVSPIETEDDREIIRSVGVNLFVSLEEFLDRLISFNVWLLSDDHFVSNRFHYDIDTARQSVVAALGSSLESNEVVATWSLNGDNSLGTLLRFLAHAASWIESLEDKERDKTKRSEDELPHFYDDKLRPFPFRHTQFWADADLTELVKYKDGFLSISRLIQQADLASIRNGIDHHRDEHNFPDADKMLACVVRLQQAVENSDISRYFPKPYWLTVRKGDRYGFIEYTYTDYASRELKVFGPSIAAGLPKKVYKYPVVIAPGNLLGYPNSQLMFRIRERSEYSKYWDGYPRRRKIESIVNTLSVGESGSLEGKS
ncbi:MAG: hypothetical protein ACXWT1_17385 [Methylobacter sp.]